MFMVIHTAMKTYWVSDLKKAQTYLAKENLWAGRYSYIRCGGWSGYDPTWYPIYDYPLGEPLGNATLEADGVWRRYFKSGTIVTFDTKKEEGTIKWSS